MPEEKGKPKILITGRIPDNVLRGLKQRFEVEANLEDRPMARERVLKAIADKEGLSLWLATPLISNSSIMLPG